MRAAVLVMSGALCLPASLHSAEIAPSLGKVSLGLSRVQVEEALGKPLRVLKTGDALDPEYRYEGLSVWFWDGEGVAQIRSTSKVHCLGNGICPGASRGTIDSALGKPISQDGDVLHYLVKAEACWLEVALSGAIASSLEIRCQP